MKTVTIDETDAETLYEVDLTAPVRIGRQWLRPGARNRLKGKIIKEIADNVSEVREITS